MTTANVPVPLAYDVSVEPGRTGDFPSLIAALKFNPIDQRLYVIEQARRGLLRIDLIGGGQVEGIFR